MTKFSRDIIRLAVALAGLIYVVYYYRRSRSRNLLWVLIGGALIVLIFIFDVTTGLLGVQFPPSLYTFKEAVIAFLLGIALATIIIFLFFVKEQPRNPNNKEK